MSDKDRWDKADIVSKFIVPIIVAGSVLLWNWEKGNQAASASMVQIAIGILTTPPNETHVEDPLRDWAIETMKNPSNPPVLSDAAAMQLKVNSTIWVDIWKNTGANGIPFNWITPGIVGEDDKLYFVPLAPNEEKE